MSDLDGCGTGEGRQLESAIAADPELLAAGWVRRYLADSDRAREAVELYTKLGYEVKAQELTPANFDTSCGDCPSHVCQAYVLIYTRKLPD